jgi:uncharacterized circularly permuted ATP-grasp superfamily protein
MEHARARAAIQGDYYVLEDNLRVPSGVSYMLEEPQDDDAAVPRAVRRTAWRRSRTTPTCCWKPCAPAPPGRQRPTVVVLTPGMYNSAYFEHAFLAQQMGVELVEGRTCSSRTTSSTCAPRAARKRVDVIYRRVDDDFLDPQVFRPTPCWACAGLIEAYRAGNVTHLQRCGHRRGRRQVDLPLRAEMIASTWAKSRS